MTAVSVAIRYSYEKIPSLATRESRKRETANDVDMNTIVCGMVFHGKILGETKLLRCVSLTFIENPI